jgi:hypothetical protein
VTDADADGPEDGSGSTGRQYGREAVINRDTAGPDILDSGAGLPV